jgi:hypothetical protein
MTYKTNRARKKRDRRFRRRSTRRRRRRGGNNGHAAAKIQALFRGRRTRGQADWKRKSVKIKAERQRKALHKRRRKHTAKKANRAPPSNQGDTYTWYHPMYKPVRTRKTFSGGRRRRKNHSGGMFGFFKKDKNKNKRRQEKEEREEVQMRKRADQELKLQTAALAEEDYLASENQARISNMEKIALMRAAEQTSWEYAMTTPEYQTFLYETWKVNSERDFTREELLLVSSLLRYDPAGYKAIYQSNFRAPRGWVRSGQTWVVK